jgi:hypothetical protein
VTVAYDPRTEQPATGLAGLVAEYDALNNRITAVVSDDGRFCTPVLSAAAFAEIDALKTARQAVTRRLVDCARWIA